MRTRTLSLFLMTAIFGAVATYAAIGSAAERRQPANNCVRDDATTPSGGLLHAFSLIQGTTTAATRATCPYDDDDRFPKQSVNTLNLHLFSNCNSEFCNQSARACSQPFSGGAANCTFFKATNGIGALPLTFNHTDLAPAWGPTFKSDWGYIEVNLSQGSNLYGYFSST